MIGAHIQVEGLAELQAAIRAAEGKLPKALGDAHKEIGRFIIGKLPDGNPHAVGAGSGATVRPSATKRDVILRVGGSHRGVRRMQWGKKEVQPFEAGRPYIIGTVEDNQAAIEDKFLDEYLQALGPAFYSATRG
jgi:hypothetical protein